MSDRKSETTNDNIEAYELRRIPAWKIDLIVAHEREGWEPVSRELGEVTLRRRKYAST